MANEIPLVSVIIPMYNSSKYIGELLNSLLRQTLKNFEVIIVDDCSTDYSCAIVESYTSEFGERLYLVKMKNNTGGPSLPRNKGLEISRGKYVFFMDSDDAITNTALKDLYDTAKQFEADVIICKKHFHSYGFAQDLKKNMQVIGNEEDTEVQLIVGDFRQKIEAWKAGFFGVYPWTKFILRNFLIENDIKFLPVIQEDSIWTFELVCLAKKCALIPQPCYIHRLREDSLTKVAFQKNLDVDGVKRKMDRIVNGLKHVDNFMSGFDDFKNAPDLRYNVLAHILFQNLNWVNLTWPDAPPHLIYETFKASFSAELGEYDVLISALVTTAITYIKNFSIANKQLTTQIPYVVKKG